MAEKQGDQYDLVVIGSGPGGERAAAQAAYFGFRVALVEKCEEPGGAGINTGTIPSKTLREAALFLSGAQSRGLHGVNLLVKRDISADDFMYRQRYVVARQRERFHWNMDRHRVDFIHGMARIESRDSVVVAEEEGPRRLTTRFIVIATGSTPRHPDFLPFDDPWVFDSDSILEMHTLPKSMACIGAGVIGCEYATFFAAMDIRVVLINSGDRLLPFLDHELSDHLQDEMSRGSIQVLSGERVQSVTRVDVSTLRVLLTSGVDFEVQSVLFAAGRRPATEGLGLVEVGVAVDDQGQVTVDENFQTSVPGIYAIGDVIGFPALASTSMDQGRRAACHAFGFDFRNTVDRQMPFGIYTVPSISMVGETEESLKERGVRYAVGRAGYSNNPRSQIIGDEHGFIKLVFCPDSFKLLGVHIIGERSTELIHLGACVIQFGGAIDYFIQTVFNHPTLSEIYKYAAYDGLRSLPKKVQRNVWRKVD
jgi:NAD(P) transhydrogenase